jgi:hypothetical protein
MEENMSRQTVVAAMVVAQKAALLGILDNARKTDPGIDARIQGALDKVLGQRVASRGGPDEFDAEIRGQLASLLNARPEPVHEQPRITLRRRFLNWLEAG